MANPTSKPQITTTATMQVGVDLTAGDLLRFTQSVPAEAKVSICVDRGGHQLDPGSTTITATWNGAATNQGFQLPQHNIPGAR